MYCVQFAGSLKRGSSAPIVKVHAAKRNNIIREYNLKGMELSLNENTGQAQILFFLETQGDVRKFLPDFQRTMAPYAPFLETENRLNISSVSAFHSV